MKTLRNIALIILLSMTLFACGGGGNGSNKQGSQPSPIPQAPAAGIVGDGRLGELVEWSRAAQDLPGLAVVIVANGQIAEMAAEGVRSLSSSEAVTPDDSWHIGSLTKSMTATLAGALVEMSVISWNTRPLDVWPELGATIHPQLRNITIRQLLSHTAGIQRVNSVANRYGDSAAGTLPEKRRQLAAELLQASPVVPVGSYSYSNGGYIIVGAMLETLMSSAWETLLSDYVLLPLGMQDTGFGAPGTPGAFDQPWGHLPSGNRLEPVSPGPDADNPQIFGPAGTVHTTLSDYAKYMVAHIDGARGIGGILTADTYAMLHTPVIDGSGLGWGVTESTASPGDIQLAHAGSNMRWYAVVRLVPAHSVGVLYISNAGGDRADVAIDRLNDLVVARVKASL